MDAQIKALNNRIKTIRARNKQINDAIKSNSPGVNKTALNAEKERNNNELRQIRIQRYNLDPKNESGVFIKECCQQLKRLGIIKSAHQFCKEFLHKSPDYLAIMICENRKPTLDLLHFLLTNLKIVSSTFLPETEEHQICERLQLLIYKGQSLISKQLTKYL